jgi:hypothetical protein
LAGTGPEEIAVESPRLVRWKSLTQEDFDAIDRTRAPRGDPRRLLAMLRSSRAALQLFAERSYSGAAAAASAGPEARRRIDIPVNPVNL